MRHRCAMALDSFLWRAANQVEPLEAPALGNAFFGNMPGYLKLIPPQKPKPSC
jgi:hypothetical protein